MPMMFALGTVVVGALLVGAISAPLLGVQFALWMPVTLAGSILLLWPRKAVCIAQQPRHHALGGGPATP